MKKTFVILLAAGVLALTSTAVMAAESKLPSFEELDIDGNGSISAKEASPCEALMNCFVKADADHDGQLNLAEYEAIGADKEKKVKLDVYKLIHGRCDRSESKIRKGTAHCRPLSYCRLVAINRAWS